jgi:eukaryotic-like serine/threonine-protein kinase
VRTLDSLNWQRLAGTEDALDPFWSPNSAEIGFFTADKVKRVGATGGDVRTICDRLEAIGGAWSPDDTILIGVQNGIHRVAAAGGIPTRLSPTTDFWPHFLPDGNHYLFFSAVGENPPASISPP